MVIQSQQLSQIVMDAAAAAVDDPDIGTRAILAFRMRRSQGSRT
jgi:hypothetical protein